MLKLHDNVKFIKHMITSYDNFLHLPDRTEVIVKILDFRHSLFSNVWLGRWARIAGADRRAGPARHISCSMQCIVVSE